MSFVASAEAVILLDSGDPARNTTTPGDNSGWQFEGQFNGFLGTPIAPLYFITAGHIGGGLGNTFTFHGETYTTTAAFPDPSSDLQIWKVDHPFSTWAPLYTGPSEVGAELRVFGNGARRGTSMLLNDELRGWAWGGDQYVTRWGSNIVTALPLGGLYLQAEFNSPGVPSEAHLSSGDSGGGVFVLQDGLWRLAAINYAVDDLYTAPMASAGFVAAIFDARGYYYRDDQGTGDPADDTFPQIVDASGPVPTSFYSTRIKARLSWIQGIIETTGAPAPEDFGDWLSLYFTPAQIAGASATPVADPDEDGIPNGLEFALNLDPTFSERVTMTPSTGIRGLPFNEVVETSGTPRVTIEFVRRKALPDPGVVYVVEFNSDLANASGWQAGGSESVTSINERWERVRVVDSTSGPARYVRLRVDESN